MRKRNIKQGVGDHPPERSPLIGKTHTARLAAPVWPPAQEICFEHDMIMPCARCDKDAA